MSWSAAPGDLNTVASWLETVWCVTSDAALCCDVCTCGHIAGTFRASEPTETHEHDLDYVIRLWSST